MKVLKELAREEDRERMKKDMKEEVIKLRQRSMNINISNSDRNKNADNDKREGKREK